MEEYPLIDGLQDIKKQLTEYHGNAKWCIKPATKRTLRELPKVKRVIERSPCPCKKAK